MAITNNGTKVNLPDSQLPSGYTKPTVTTFTDYEYTRDLTLEVTKSTVHDATASTTLANILANGTVGLNKQVSDILDADYLATATVDAYAELITLRTNYSDVSGSGDFLTNTAAKYVCTLKLYVKTS